VAGFIGRKTCPGGQTAAQLALAIRAKCSREQLRTH
jgi:hypothetical protein